MRRGIGGEKGGGRRQEEEGGVLHLRLEPGNAFVWER